jgi:hypothetical protein
MLQPQPDDLDFGDGVAYNAGEDVFILACGTGAQAVIMGAKELATIIARGFAGMQDQEEQETASEAVKCPGCGRYILWVKIDNSEHRWLALDSIPSPNGTLVLTADRTHARALMPGTEPTGPTYNAHVGWCDWMRQGERRWAGPGAEAEDS